MLKLYSGVAIPLSFILFSLFDFYINGFRVFEIIGYLVIIPLFILKNRKIKNNIYMGALYLLIYILYSLLISDNYKTILGITLSAILYLYLINCKIIVSQKIILFLLFLNLLAFFFQLTIYHISENIINYHFFTDIESRLTSSIFRPAGFFYEPAIYSLAIYMLYLLVDQKIKFYKFISCITISSLLLSFSFLGIFMGIFLFIKSFHKNIKIIFISIVLIALLFYLLISLGSEYYSFIYNRVSNISEDGSAQERYLGFINLFIKRNFLEIFFGSGIGSNFEEFGQNLVSSIISQFGILGGILGLTYVLTSGKNRAVRFILILPVLISAPIITYGFFAFWLSQFFYSNCHRGFDGKNG
jgi:hypothetical protein